MYKHSEYVHETATHKWEFYTHCGERKLLVSLIRWSKTEDGTLSRPLFTGWEKIYERMTIPRTTQAMFRRAVARWMPEAKADAVRDAEALEWEVLGCGEGGCSSRKEK